MHVDKLYGFTSKQVRNLRNGVRGALVFGIATSVTANVIHSLTQPHQFVWQIWAASFLSGLAPVVLFTAMEMVTRIPVSGRVLGAIRLLITGALAGLSGWVSYSHMVAVSRMLGESGGSEYIYPFLIDGLMIVATISLIELGRIAETVLTRELEVIPVAAPVKPVRKAKTPVPAPVAPVAPQPVGRSRKAKVAAPATSGGWYDTTHSAAPVTEVTTR